MTTNRIAREIHLTSRPKGIPRSEDFALAHIDLPEPAQGQVLVENTWLSVDPYMRGRMDDVASYLPPFALGAPMDGGAVGRVIVSQEEALPVGTTVSHFAGWRSHAVLGVDAVIPIDVDAALPEDYLGALGTTGLTAYVALTRIAPLQEGEVVFISAAGGAVGSIAGQLARLQGASTVIGSAGGQHKTERLLSDFGFDAALDYTAGDLTGQLREVAPEGVDVYLDLVGGDHLDAALDRLNDHGRVALIGAISGYNAAAPIPGPKDFFRAYAKRLSLRGMLISDHLDVFGEYLPQAIGWLEEGSLRAESTVLDGLEHAPEAFISLFEGSNIGKMLVRL